MRLSRRARSLGLLGDDKLDWATPSPVAGSLLLAQTVKRDRFLADGPPTFRPATYEVLGTYAVWLQYILCFY
jgi:hypothetical protein